MTTITLYRREGVFCGFRAEGHAGFSEKGSDIVCAAVSALTQSVLLGLEEVVGIPVRVRRSDREGLLEVILPRNERADKIDQAQVLLRTLLSGLNCISRDYPGFVRVICKEWRLSKCSR